MVRLRRFASILRRAKSVDACVKLAREYGAAAESYAKVAGWLVEGGSNTTIDNRRQIVQVLGNLTEDELRALVANGATSASEIGTPLRDVKTLNP